MGMIIDATLDLKGIKAKHAELFYLGGPIQRFIDSTVLRGVEPYVPMKVGTLRDSATFHTQIGQGMITWRTPRERPYAPIVYYGLHLNFSRAKHPKAGPEWAKRYKADNLSALSGMVRKRVKEEWDRL